MTKRISQANTVAVPATAKAATIAAVTPVVAAAEAEVAAVTAEVADKEVVETVVVEPVAAIVAPAPIAMVAEPVAAAEPAQDTSTTSTTSTSTDSGSDTDYTPYIVGGVLLAGGILAVALSSGEDKIDTVAPTPTPTNAVTFSSATTASVAENTAAGATGVVAIDVNAAASSTTSGAITYTLGGTDAAAFSINATTGEVRFVNSPNFEAKSSYTITVTANAAANGTTPAATASQTITVNVTNVNEAPTFASATVTATPVAENIATSTVVYTAAATDPDAVAGSTPAGSVITYSLGTTGDSAAFAINPTTGAVTFRASPDFETKSSYTFSVIATDNGTPGLTATQTVTLNVTNVAEAPVFATTTRATSYAENGTAAVIAAGGATDSDAGSTITYTITGADAALFSVNSTTGAVSFRASPDFETPRSAANSNVYSFNLVATDNTGLATTQANTVEVTNVVNEGIAIDGGTIPASTAVTYSGANGNVTFLETGAAGNVSTITNFTNGDIILTDVAASNYSFSSDGTTLRISYNNNGVVSDISILNGVANTGITVVNEQTAEQAAGFDFFRSSAPAAPAANVSLDAAGAASTTYNAGATSATYTDAVGQANVSVINNFSADDRIVMTGINGSTAGTTASFTSDGRDLIISFNNGGIVNQITLTNVVSANGPIIVDERTAEAAIGFDFFRYG